MATDFPKRTKPSYAGRARVTPRDLLALQFIAQAQCVHTGQLRRLLSMSCDMLWRRMRVLRDLRMVRVHVPEGAHRPNRYTLGPAAPALLARALGEDIETFRVPRGIGNMNLAHHDGVVDIHLALVVACARSRSVELDEFIHERDIRAMLGIGGRAQVPDAVAKLIRPDGSQISLALEIDLATENPRYVRDRKGEAYAQLKLSAAPLLGCSDWVVCFVAPSGRRLNRLVKALHDVVCPEGLFYYSQADEVVEANILTSAWSTVRSNRKQARLVIESPISGALPVRTPHQNGSDGPTPPEPGREADPGPEAASAFARSRPLSGDRS